MRRKILSIFISVVIIASVRVSIMENLGPLSLNATGEEGLADSPWPMFRGNLNHTGLSFYNTSTNPGNLIWSFMTNRVVESSPTIGSDGKIYIGSNDHQLYAIDPDGTEEWNFTTGGQVWSTPAIGSDGTIYVGSLDDKLYAINSNGTEKWNFTTGGQVWSSPAIGSDGTIYVGSYDCNLYAINSNGTEKWRFQTDDAVQSSPAIGSNGTIYIGSKDGKLYAINSNGSEKWNFIDGGNLYSSPAIGSDGTIYIGSSNGKLNAINHNSSEKWSFMVGDEVYSSPAIAFDGTIYIGCLDAYFYAINPNGTEKWKFPTGVVTYSTPAIGSDGTIFIGSLNSRLYAINPDGTERWNFSEENKAISSSPAIGSDGTVYFGSRSKKLYAIGVSNQPPIAVAGPDQTIYLGDEVQFNGSASYDPDGIIVNYKWDFNASDGLWWETGDPPDAVGPTSIHTYEDNGVYIVTLNVTDNNGSSDIDTCIITVLVPPPLPPMLYINASQDGENVILYWDPPSTLGIDHYLIYRSTSQTDFDFNTVWVNTAMDNETGKPGPIPLRTMWNDTKAALPGDPNYEKEYYYIIRAVNTLGKISNTSRTVGKWTKTFPQGVSTFSLPLEPLGNFDIELYTSNMNASYIKWMDHTTHTWMRHDKGYSENNTFLELGKGYEVEFDNQTIYTFCGMPGAMIIYDDENGFSGFDCESEAKNLTASVEINGDVSLTWQEPSSMASGDWYEVYYSNNRDGFFGAPGINYDLACPSIGFGTNTTTISGLGASNPGARLYFMVIPFNTSGVRGSSTYSIGVWTQEYLSEYDTIGIPLKLDSFRTADWFCDNIPDCIGINYCIYNDQRWGWHATRMPAGAFDVVLEMGEGYQISTAGATKFTFIGV